MICDELWRWTTKAMSDLGCGHCDVFFRMKCVMIFLVLTLVVLMAEPGESRSRFGRFLSGVYHGIKAGMKGK